MSHVSTERLASSGPVAGLDRRFYAFMVDRLIAWTLVAAACWAAYELFWTDDQTWAGVALVAVVVVAVWVVFAVALGVVGTTPAQIWSSRQNSSYAAQHAAAIRVQAISRSTMNA